MVTVSPAHSQRRHWGNRGCGAGLAGEGPSTGLGALEAHEALGLLQSVLQDPRAVVTVIVTVWCLVPLAVLLSHTGASAVSEQPMQTPRRLCERPGGFPQARTRFGGQWRVWGQRHLRAQVLPGRDFNCSRDPTT